MFAVFFVFFSRPTLIYFCFESGQTFSTITSIVHTLGHRGSITSNLWSVLLSNAFPVCYSFLLRIWLFAFFEQLDFPIFLWRVWRKLKLLLMRWWWLSNQEDAECGRGVQRAEVEVRLVFPGLVQREVPQRWPLRRHVQTTLHRLPWLRQGKNAVSYYTTHFDIYKSYWPTIHFEWINISNV